MYAVAAMRFCDVIPLTSTVILVPRSARKFKFSKMAEGGGFLEGDNLLLFHVYTFCVHVYIYLLLI
jgi:hypothetical protein